jgi:hypothetical protein
VSTSDKNMIDSVPAFILVIWSFVIPCGELLCFLYISTQLMGDEY